MEITGSANPLAAPTPSVEVKGKLAALRALRQALEREQEVLEDQHAPEVGEKGRLLDIRC